MPRFRNVADDGANRYRGQVGRVGGVEHVHPILKAPGFTQLECFGNREVQVVEAGRQHGVSSHSPGIGQSNSFNPVDCVRVHACSSSQVGIEESGWTGGRDGGAHGARVQGRRGVADIRTVRTNLPIAVAVSAVRHRERLARLEIGDSRKFPIAQDLAQQAGLGRADLPREPDRPDMAAVEVRVAVVDMRAGAQHLRNGLHGTRRGVERENVAHIVQEMSICVRPAQQERSQRGALIAALQFKLQCFIVGVC